jgi:hypothetical protein
VTIATYPFCISCGNDLTLPNFKDDQFCDSCGFEYGFSSPAFDAPVATPTGAVGEVSFEWTDNPEADSTQSQVSGDGGATWSAWATDTSPTVVTVTTGTKGSIRLRSVVDGVPGAYRQFDGVTA